MIRFGYADTPFGQIHHATCGTGEPVLLLHQTPRSWDEYREVLPLLGRTRRAIAMDTLGFGNSARPPEHSIETYAAGVLALMDALDLPRAAVAGHHTGGVVAVETAARAPDRVTALVLSSTPMVDPEGRRRRAGHPSIDAVREQSDGSHLGELWSRRAPYYPWPLLTRFVRDALTVLPEVEHGHEAVAAYRMEERVGLVRCPVLVVGATDDPFAFPELERLAAALPHSTQAVVKGGVIPLEHQAAEFAALVADFLDGQARETG